MIDILKKINKKAADFSEINDWFDDETVEDLREYESNDIGVVDYDALERGEIPADADEEVDSILVDNLVDETGQEIQEPQEELEAPTEKLLDVPTEEEAEEAATPSAEESEPDIEETKDIKEHFGRDIRGAIEEAIDEGRVMQIFYNTEGRKRGRGGKEYLKREVSLPKIKGTGGVNINRIIEPHYIFPAKTTGNDILVTYDRSVRHIRAFIVDNITDYNFTKKRGTDEDQYFKPRERVMNKSEQRQGIETMKNTNKSLVKIASTIEEKGMVKVAAVLKDVSKTIGELKTAQYVGIQGYWLRNRRCWDNCYRHKRTAQPKTPVQEVWTECWNEYKASINDDLSGWEKYAKQGGKKVSKKQEEKWNKLFNSKVASKMKNGYGRPEAIYATFEEESKQYEDKIIENASKLMSLAETFSENGFDKMGQELVNVSTEILKEAGLWGDIGNWAREAPGDIGKGIGNKVRDIGKGIGNKVRDIGKSVGDWTKNKNQQYQEQSKQRHDQENKRKERDLIGQLATTIFDTFQNTKDNWKTQQIVIQQMANKIINGKGPLSMRIAEIINNWKYKFSGCEDVVLELRELIPKKGFPEIDTEEVPNKSLSNSAQIKNKKGFLRK
jgi:hypothetical protein